jgi:tetrahydromethanopterin S-methyltransferase subunit G
MIDDLEKRLDAVCESMESAATDYNQSTQCLVEALTGIHERLERIEKWIESQESPQAKD